MKKENTRVVASEGKLEEMNKDGWTLVTASEGYMYFEREIQPQNESSPNGLQNMNEVVE